MESTKHIEVLCGALQKKVEADWVVLLETTGQIIYSTGASQSQLPILSSLIIGLSSAGRELFSQMGEKQSTLLVQEGFQKNIISSFVTSDIILMLVLPKTENVGFAKFKMKQYRVVLKALLARWKNEMKLKQHLLATVTEAELDRLLEF